MKSSVWHYRQGPQPIGLWSQLLLAWWCALDVTGPKLPEILSTFCGPQDLPLGMSNRDKLGRPLLLSRVDLCLWLEQRPHCLDQQLGRPHLEGWVLLARLPLTTRKILALVTAEVFPMASVGPLQGVRPSLIQSNQFNWPCTNFSICSFCDFIIL